MEPMPSLRYQPVENGYAIAGGRDVFNRTLYGGHAHDEKPERFFTLAGDLPLFMGAVTDWSRHTACHYAKCGVLASGLALTPGVSMPHFYSADLDIGSRWFHASDGVAAVFRNGWMEYEVRQFSPWFPDVRVAIAAFPLLPEDGFLVHYRIETDQQVLFCAGVGGLTEFIGRFEYRGVALREFHAADAEGNRVTGGRNRALIQGPRGDALWVGASFPVTVDAGDAAALEPGGNPAAFLKRADAAPTRPVARLSAPIGPGETLDGFLVVLRNEDESVLDRWLAEPDPGARLKRAIRTKHAGVTVHTPDPMLNLTVPPTVLAMDASWHAPTFCHGAHGYHSPFLGWRNWYGPTVLGWHGRVEQTIRAHFAELVREAPGPERVWYDGGDRPDLDHEGTQYHQIRNSTGFVPCLLGKNDIYNMQEVAVSMALHHLEWTGDLALAGALFDDLDQILDWEERILDPDGDGLYQNFLNTWISDGHSYNGGGCAQASAYNLQANRIMAGLADRLGRPAEKFRARAEKISAALNTILWLPANEVLAEFVDTIGNKLVHPSPELATLYLAVECGAVDPFQACQMLRFAETELRRVRTPSRNGRLVYSSNWYPKKYSTCGLFPAENMHLAWAYYRMGWKTEGWALLTALVECFFSGNQPGQVSHVLAGAGASDLGDLDFTDVSSLYLRLVVEGLFGVRANRMDGTVDIAPNFPAEWPHAALTVGDLSLAYTRDGVRETLTAQGADDAVKRFRLPLRANRVEGVWVNGAAAEYRLEPGIDACFLVVEARAPGRIHLEVDHGRTPPPVLAPAEQNTWAGNTVGWEADRGRIAEWRAAPGLLDRAEAAGRALRATAAGTPGRHTVFARVVDGEFDAWLTAELRIRPRDLPRQPGPLSPEAACAFEPVDLTRYFNVPLAGLHSLEYRSPRPEGYSIGVRLNGRYAWEWNHGGHNAVPVDDTALRRAGGRFVTPSGIAFATPVAGPNAAAISIWDNFPTVLRIPLRGRAAEAALLLIGVTNPMQAYVENARVTAVYRAGPAHAVSLVHPVNFDDWLVPALQAENETVYFSDTTHGLVQRIALDPRLDLAELVVEAAANEVIIGLLGISLRRA